MKIGDKLCYDLSVDETPVMTNATLTITIDGNTLGEKPKVADAVRRTQRGNVNPVVRQKAAVLKENFNELCLKMQGAYSVVDQGGRILKRGADLARVVAVLEKKPKLVDL